MRKQEEFEQIVQLYSKELYGFARSILYCHEDANDCLQESFIKVWKSIHTLRKTTSIKAWLYQIVRNSALDHLRKQSTTRIVEYIESDIQEKTTSGIPIQDELILRKLEQELSKMSETKQAIFRLRYYSELPFLEIAVKLGSTENSVKANYSTIKKKLTKEILEWEL